MVSILVFTSEEVAELLGFNRWRNEQNELIKMVWKLSIRKQISF